ncbi:MAG: glycosyltransferase family 2 protein [Chloroflexi bacterium]|nr:glycosyltransferase family 2 protein [Chloroflexota bacterium]
MSQNGHKPFLSVVIPTHNRRDVLIRILEALFSQDYPQERLQVVVVLDDCTDDTELALNALNPPVSLEYLCLPKVGQAAARNKGIRQSVGDLIVFLDDDVEPAPGFLRAHASAHSPADNLVVQGYYPFSRQLKRHLHMLSASRWWERHFERLGQPGRKLGPCDLCTGNLSVRREHLMAVGGFDEAFGGYGNEDYELGWRLSIHGLEFRFCREALGWHHYATPLSKSLMRTREEARADVTYGRKYPHLKRSFRLFTLTQERSISRTLIRALAFQFPKLGDRIASRLLKLMYPLERLGLRGTWTRINWTLRRYYYWRGITDSLGSYRALKEYLGNDWVKHPAKTRTRVTGIDLQNEAAVIEGLEGYEAAYILVKNGARPLSWLWMRSADGWLGPSQIKEAIEAQAWAGVTRGGVEGVRLMRAFLPSIIPVQISGRPRPLSEQAQKVELNELSWR